MRIKAKQQRIGEVPDSRLFVVDIAVCATAHRRPIQTDAPCVVSARRLTRVRHLLFTHRPQKDHHHAN